MRPLRAPPILSGYIYTGDEAYAARDAGRLLAIRLETNKSCNLQCRYCYAESGGVSPSEASLETLCEVVSQAKELGAESIVVIGGGEPTLHPRFLELIMLINALKMIPVIFTNLTTMTPQLAGFLRAQNASIMGKLDSLRPEIQDFLAGRAGAFTQIHWGLINLLDAGYGEVGDTRRLRLGLSFVSCKLNMDEVEDIWHYCRRRRIFPNMEVLTPTGRARGTLDRYSLSKEEIQRYKLRLLDIDREVYGFDWLPYTPLTASGCMQHLYSLYVTVEGNVRPCAPAKFDQHESLREDGLYPYNVLRVGLREIYESELFTYVRNIDRHLEGKCRDCEHLRECIGCRGYAYSVGVNEGKSPREALRAECSQCFK